jgi:hypothetical protein
LAIGQKDKNLTADYTDDTDLVAFGFWLWLLVLKLPITNVSGFLGVSGAGAHSRNPE